MNRVKYFFLFSLDSFSIYSYQTRLVRSSSLVITIFCSPFISHAIVLSLPTPLYSRKYAQQLERKILNTVLMYNIYFFPITFFSPKGKKNLFYLERMLAK